MQNMKHKESKGYILQLSLATEAISNDFLN